MKKFKFRLEKILELRNADREEAQREVAKRTEELRRQQAIEMQIFNQLNEIAASKDSSTMAEIALKNQFLEFLSKSLFEQKQVVAQAKQVLGEAQGIFLEKAKDAKALEVLREKREKQFYKEQEEKERKKLEELVICRYRAPQEG